jgi:hypothetical protein
MSDPCQKSHPGWPYSPREQYFRMLRDYELVRVPMQRGEPSASPKGTRNPARGFLHMRREFVENTPYRELAGTVAGST